MTTKRKTAIDEQRSTTFMVDPTKPLIIGLDTKHKRGEHPLWQERALEPVDEALALNIANNGFRSVVLVRLDGTNYEVVAGRRRVKAARRANEIRAARGEQPLKIELKVVRGNDLAMVGIMISENANRKDVAPIQMAEDLQKFLDMGADEETTANAAGKTVVQLRAFLRLLDLDETVKEAVRNGQLSQSAAIRLAELGREEQVQEMAKIASGESGSTAADVAAKVRAKKEGSEDVLKAPGKRLINKLLESAEGKAVLSSADGVQVVRWMVGELSPRNIKGLVAAINKVSGK
jgi:ParB family chromosome partitioning protein